MVIADHSNAQSEKRRRRVKSEHYWWLASPVDRLAANVVDFIILVPLASLAFALIKKEMIFTQFFGTVAHLQALQFVYYLFLPILIHFVYHTVFNAMVGSSPGKYFFSLRVVDLWTRRKPSWGKSFLRSVLWWWDVVTLLPLLAVFSDRRRRCLHDRFSDTVVTSTEARSVASPGFGEKLMAQSLFAGLLFMVVAVVSSHSSGPYREAFLSAVKSSEWVGGESTCGQVDQAAAEWQEKGSEESRLQVAMALFAARAIDSDCLDAEANHYIWRENRTSSAQGVGYLAKAFAHVDDQKKSDEYLTQVCLSDPSSESCDMSQIFDLWNEERWSQVSQQLTKMSERPSTYVKIWAIRHFFRLGQTEYVRSLVESVSPNQALANFLGEYRIKSLWRDEMPQQAEGAFKLYWESRRQNERLSLANWLCYEEVLRSCSGWQAPSCRVLDLATTESPQLLKQIRVGLTHLRGQECRKESSKELHLFSPELLSYQGTFNSEKWKDHELFDNLMTLAEDERRDEVLRFDALSRALKASRQEGDLQRVVEFWSEKSSGDFWGWHLLGEPMAQRLAQEKRLAKAAEVMERVYRSQGYSRRVVQRLVELEFEQNHRDKAWHWLKVYRAGKRNSARQVASVPSWSEIERALDSEFSSQ